MNSFFSGEFFSQESSIEIIPSESKVSQRLAEFSALTEGWHFGEGVEFRQEIIDRTSEILKLLRDGWVIDLSVYPCVNGDVHLLAKCDRHRLELFIREDGLIDFCEEVNGTETLDKADVEFDEYLMCLKTWIRETRSTSDKLGREDQSIWSSSESLARPMTIKKMREDFKVVTSPNSMVAFLWLASRASKKGENLYVATSMNTTPVLRVSAT